MATVPNPTPATLDEAIALLGALATEKRLLELRIQDLEHRLYGSSSEKLPIEDRQLARIDEVFDNPEPATTDGAPAAVVAGPAAASPSVAAAGSGAEAARRSPAW